jgi:hypothetical protein
MKFLVDAQLPLRLARLLQEAGYDTLHTMKLTPPADRVTNLNPGNLTYPPQRPARQSNLILEMQEK